MKLVKMTRHDGHNVDVHPSMVDDYRKGAYVVDDDQGEDDAPAGIGTDSGDQFSDEQLRAVIKDTTGKAPHHNMGRAKLIEAFDALNKADDQDEEASNGLTRREIEADLTAMNIDFDPRDALEDLAALRDLEREQRQQ